MLTLCFLSNKSSKTCPALICVLNTLTHYNGLGSYTTAILVYTVRIMVPLYSYLQPLGIHIQVVMQHENY